MLDFHEGLGGWLAGCLAGWLAGLLAGWGTKMRQKRIPLARKCVENANPQHENASKVRTLSPKFHPRDPDERRKCDPFIKKCVENATPHAENACLIALPQALGSISAAENRNPSHEIASQMRTLQQKVCVEMAKMATLHQK